MAIAAEVLPPQQTDRPLKQIIGVVYQSATLEFPDQDISQVAVYSKSEVSRVKNSCIR